MSNAKRTQCRSRGLLPAVFAFVMLAATAQYSSAKPDLPFTISKETTYITEPLDADGYPDYVAALNQRLSQGVTPENNAAVILLKITDMEEHLCGGGLEKYYQMLGISTLPKKDLFVNEVDYAREHPKWKRLVDPNMSGLFDQEEKVKYGPWSKEKFPFFAEWLAANEKSLAILVEASKRPRYFDPIVPGRYSNADFGFSKDRFDPGMPYWTHYYGVYGFKALLLRALSREYEGNVAEAWEDILACHRLVRLMGQLPTVDSTFMADIKDRVVLKCSRTLLENARLTSRQIADMRLALDQLSPMPNVSEKFDQFGRIVCLSWALKCQREGLSTLKKKIEKGQGLQPYQDSKSSEAFAKSNLDMLNNDFPIDWNVVLKTINSYFDQIGKAQRLPAGIERMEAVQKVRDDILAKAAVPFDPKRENPETYSKRIALAFFFSEFLPNSVTHVDDSALMDLQVTKLGFALAQYGIDRNAYPDKLTDLVPKYVARVPKDFFLRDAELHYRREGNGYVLYSVGPNGKDDGGKACPSSWGSHHNPDGSTTYTDDKGNVYKENPRDWDDIVVRMPAKRSHPAQ